MQRGAEVKFMIWLPAPANYVKGHSSFPIRCLHTHSLLAAYYKALPYSHLGSPPPPKPSFVTVVCWGRGSPASWNRIKTLLWVASDWLLSVILGITNISLALQQTVKIQRRASGNILFLMRMVSLRSYRFFFSILIFCPQPLVHVWFILGEGSMWLEFVQILFLCNNESG